jgi:hypothetical protein
MAQSSNRRYGKKQRVKENMEKAIPYYGDLHLDAATKKLILNLLKSIRSVVPVIDASESTAPDGDQDLKSRDYIRNVALRSRQHSDMLEGIFNPGELLRYSGYIKDYQDLITQVEQVLKELTSCRDSAWKFASRLAEMTEEHIQMFGEAPPEVSVDQDEFKLKVV